MNKIVKVALKKVNEVRGEMGYPPLTRMPKGIPMSAHNCPIARAFPLPVHVSAHAVKVLCTDDEAAKIAKVLGPARSSKDGAHKFNVLPELLSFFLRFDTGYHPELEIGNE